METLGEVGGGLVQGKGCSEELGFAPKVSLHYVGSMRKALVARRFSN